MKNIKRPAAALVVILALGFAWFVHVHFGPEPVRFVDWTIKSDRVLSTRTVTEAALAYINCDKRTRQRLRVRVSQNGDATVVTMIDPQCEDDSVFVLCDRLTMIGAEARWQVVRHQKAWQGRDRIGWTTQPTL